jgi:flagellum-specific peptidoglycan hydrolase FlgJ
MPQHVKSFFVAPYPTVMELRNKYGVLLSVKMAQAMLESGYGTSELSQIGNNYFGVKRKSDSETGYFYK